MQFDGTTLSRLAASEEVTLETARPDGSLRRTIIWLVVDGGEVFVRSVRGERGHWYQAAIDRPTYVQLLVDDRRMAVVVSPADGESEVARCSSGLALKYAGDPSLPSMLTSRVLSSTLRLEPR